MLVDPPNGAPVVIYDPCPTGNAAGGGYQLAGTYFSSHNYVQEWAAFGGITDWGTRNVANGGGYRSTDASVWTQLSFRGPSMTASCDPASDPNAGCDTSIGGAGEGDSGAMEPPPASVLATDPLVRSLRPTRDTV